MNHLSSFGWDDTIRPQRLSPSPTPHCESNKRKRSRESGDSGFDPQCASPRRMAVKKQRSHARPAQAVPVRRRIEGLSHQQLFELVESLCEHNPQIHSQVARIAPQITVESAITSLKHYLNRISEAMPYSSDSRPSDYGYLRVQPLLHDFFVALADYTTALLPPHEESLHRSLEFLDLATDLVHQVPEWESQTNNFLKDRAYGELAMAWHTCLQTLVERGAMVRFDTDARLAYHAQQSDGRMVVQNPSEPVLSIAPMQSVVA